MNKVIATDSLEVAGLTAQVATGLIDGPVAADHPDLAAENIRRLSPATGGTIGANGAATATAHGTYVAGILAARRGSSAPAICPDCTLFVRPIFLETASNSAEMPSATPDETAEAIADCVDAGTRVVNLSVAVASPSPNKEQQLEEALSYAAHRGAMLVLLTMKSSRGSPSIPGHQAVAIL